MGNTLPKEKNIKIKKLYFLLKHYTIKADIIGHYLLTKSTAAKL